MGIAKEWQTLCHRKVLLDDLVGRKGLSFENCVNCLCKALSTRPGISSRGSKTSTKGKKTAGHSRIKYYTGV
jgi:hypothetical protein